MTERREIYAEEQGIGELAEDEGFHQIPAIQTDANLLTAHESHVKRDAIIADLEKKGRATLIAKYNKFKLDNTHIDRIVSEGREKRWPLPTVPDPYKR